MGFSLSGTGDTKTAQNCDGDGDFGIDWRIFDLGYGADGSDRDRSTADSGGDHGAPRKFQKCSGKYDVSDSDGNGRDGGQRGD